MSDIVDSNINSVDNLKNLSDDGLKSPSLVSVEEFFDADDEVDNAKEDEEDFLKALESAISGNEPEPEEVEKVASESISKCENKEEEEASKLNQENDEVTKDEGEKETPHNGNGVSTDSDAEKLENDLLNDSDDINKEVDDLLASITAEELNSDEPANTDKQIVDKSKETADECSTQKEKSEAEVLEDKLLADPLEDELLNEAACVVSNSEEGESKEKITDVSTEVKNQEPAENQESREPETNDETTHSRKVSEDEPKGEDLLVACESPKPTETPSEQENKSETSSNSGETPEDSSDEKQRATESENADENKDIEDKVKPIKVVAVTQLEGMEIDELEDDSKEGETLPAEGDEVHLCMIEPTKEKVQFKINFMRKFASAVGVLSRAELEELLVQKITESFMFCSENTELRSRLEKQEKNCETFRKQLENLNKQYNDLHMIHIRVQKDLKDRPESAITPVKITRAVGLQVFSPMARQKPNQILNFQSNLHQTTIKPSNKRPASELEPVSNGKSPDSVKRKKTTPLRPQLTDKERQMLDNQEAKVEQKIRSTVIGGSTVKLPPNVTISPIQNGTVNGTSNHSSIDLTDDEESSGSAQQPPALVAIRASNGSLLQRKAFVVKTSGLATSIRSHALQSSHLSTALSRCHPAPLPAATSTLSKPGMKKLPPQPSIKINNVANGIIVSWNVSGLSPEHAEIHSYQIYAYEVTNELPKTDNWKHVGDVKALLLPMAVTLTQFQEGQKYFFSVRAVDVHKRPGVFAVAKTWTDNNR